MNDSLEISSINKAFGDFKAVDGVDFSISDGKFFSILGPSGCGKTTLLRMIAGFLEPTSGSIRIRGREMVGIPPNKRPVNLVFQNLALFPMMNVGENVAFGLKRQGITGKEMRQRVSAILDKVHLGGFESKDVSQLSGGQKQRVAIARSLVLEPSILLLDEPLGALDLKLREQMKIELKKLQHEVGTTFMYITHDQSEALVMSDIVAVMNRGKFEQIDTPQNLYANPKTSFVAEFVGETNKFDIQLTNDAKTEAVTSAGINFKIDCIDSCPNKNGTLFIRPEAVVLMADKSVDNMNFFELGIKTVLFDGSNTKVLAEIKGTDHEMMVALPQNRHFAHIQPGDVLQAGVDIKDCRCYA
jgi:spermidine/putrescine transport system ATP-binding protein